MPHVPCPASPSRLVVGGTNDEKLTVIIADQGVDLMSVSGDTTVDGTVFNLISDVYDKRATNANVYRDWRMANDAGKLASAKTEISIAVQLTD